MAVLKYDRLQRCLKTVVEENGGIRELDLQIHALFVLQNLLFESMPAILFGNDDLQKLLNVLKNDFIESTKDDGWL